MKDSTVRMQVSGTPVDRLSASSPADWWAWIWAHISPYLPPAWVWWIIGGACCVVLAWMFGRAVLRAGRRAAGLTKSYVSARPIEDVLTVVAASIATGVSATGMWRFSEDVLHLPFVLRVLLFAFIEVAIITSAVRARRNMRENFSAGIDGIAVWALTCLTAVLSSMDARSLPEAVFRLAAPLVAAWLWERGMAIERHRIRGTGRINWRLTPERVLVWAGLAEASDRTAGDVDRARRISRVSLAVLKVDDRREASDRKRRSALQAFRKAIAQAVEHANLATDEAAQEAVLAQIDTLRSADALVNRRRTARWADPVTQEKKAEAVAAMEQAMRFDTAEATQRALDEAALTLMALTERVTSPVTYPEVTGGVNGSVPEGAVPAPRRTSAATSTVIDPVTPSGTVEQVNDKVTFDITDSTIFDLEQMLAAEPVVTPALTRSVTPPEVTNKVNEDAADATKTKVMRAFWENEITQKRYPRPIDLARHADADRSLAARLRTDWVEELSGWAKRRAKAALRDKTSA